MQLGSPWWLLALVLVPLVWPRTRAARTPAVRFPSLRDVRAAGVGGGGGGARRTLGLLRVATVLLVVGALARPQVGREQAAVHREGVDIVLAVDVSGSMLAEDFTVDGARASRLAAVKDVVREFVTARPNDRIGLVLFAGRPYTQVPLTLDHGWLMQRLEGAEVGMIEDGTAIGSALATAVTRLRPSTAERTFVVLLTDGQNNAGRVNPKTAADAAAALGVTLYTVGAGTRGMAPYPARDLFGNTVYRPVAVDIDEATLREIATITGGRYFRATDTPTLREVYAEIDRAERVEFAAPVYLDHREVYPWLAWPALALLVAEIGLGMTRLRTLP